MAVDVLSKLSQLAQAAAVRLTVKSALNPLLWMSVTIGATCFGFAVLFQNDAVIKYLLVIVGLVLILLTCVVAVYFAFWKSEKLQSEEYQLRHQTLNIIEEKGGRITVDPVSLQEIANPPAPQQLTAPENLEPEIKS